LEGNLPNTLKRLKQAKNLSDVAELIGYQPKNLAYILYKIPDRSKYTSFEIDKKGGGKREINAPIERLKLVQRRVHELLLRCLLEVEKAEGVKPDCVLSHGFRPNYSIATNAKNHRGRRWVFNIDLKDFFPSINFGRVRGYLIKNRHFNLDANVATIIAQIACHDNQLPQGSPTSPVVSNLLTSVLDIRLNRLATRNRCTYTRYADDLTFSSNKKLFASEIASCVDEATQEWKPSETLRYHIFRSGFQINDAKTRMQFYWSRQDATGLVVNKKVNVKREYIKLARARCDRLFNSRECTRKFEYHGDTYEEAFGVDQLQGMLAHIFYIKGDEFDHRRQNGNSSGKDHPAFYRTYRKFLDYRAFAANEMPTLLFEGKTDSIYVKCALRAFADDYADLVDPAGTKIA
jgi:RNA-directed DNA polymerase